MDLAHGVNGNTTNAPMYVDAAHGDYRLQSSSPCINWGNNAYVSVGADLDGNPRIVEGQVDMGCYEYQGILGPAADNNGNSLPDAWERLHFGRAIDPNLICANGLNPVWEAYIAGIDPNDPDSFFAVSLPLETQAGNIVQWPSTEGRYYSVYWSTNLMQGFSPLKYDLPYPVNSITDMVHGASAQVFYKMRVSLDPLLPEGMVLIIAGTNDGTDPDFGAYSLAVPEAIFMDATEIAWETWVEVRDWAVTNGYDFANAGQAKAPGHPVHSINWFDCAKWCNARSEMEGRTPCYTVGGATYRTGDYEADTDSGANGFRLPTRVEWEYAARGGLSGKRFPWGDTITHTNANYLASHVFPYDENPVEGYHPTYCHGSEPYSAPCGSFPANGYGLHDMAGNMWEWCDDVTDVGRRARAGGDYSTTDWLRCGAPAFSGADGPTDNYYHSLGFRTVCGLEDRPGTVLIPAHQ